MMIGGDRPAPDPRGSPEWLVQKCRTVALTRRRSYQCQAPLRGSGVKTADKTFMSHSSEEGMLL